MYELTLWQNGKCRKLYFEGERLLDDVLHENGIYTAHPCGGWGSCGKCAVELRGEVSEPNDAERRAGMRLSCQAVLLGDAEVILPDAAVGHRIETATAEHIAALHPMEGSFGAAVDIGTTTIAVKAYELSTGKYIGTAAGLNPQGAIAADVMGRIAAAMRGEGERLREQVTKKLDELLREAMGGALPDSMVITGNTTMLYLLVGLDPTSLSRAPFIADTLFNLETEILNVKAYLPPCMNAFVGADITTAVLASGMCKSNSTSLLCDIGTNGEMALWKDGRLYVTSTAAGPAFEGAGISCGCGSVSGAVDRVWTENGRLCVHTIADAPAVGVCGSGLIDAIAAGLRTEQIDETGSMDEDELVLCDNVVLEPQDVRAVQLAKAAIAAGMEMLIETAGASMDEIETLYIAGGFGSHLNVSSAAEIGLLPKELAERARIIGNAALSGAAEVLLNGEARAALNSIAESSEHVNLGGDPRFNEKYVDKMFFGDEI